MDSRNVTNERGDLETWEAAFLLQRHESLADADAVTEHLVTELLRLRRRRLSKPRTRRQDGPELPLIRVSSFVKVSATGLRSLVTDDELATLLLDAICTGRLVCPRATCPDQPVPSLVEGLRRLAAEVAR